MFLAPLTALVDEGIYTIFKELHTTLIDHIVKEETKVKRKVPQIHE